MTRRLLPILILMLVLTSCMHQSPFRSEYYFQAMGREGDIVIAVNDCSLLSGFLPDEIIGRAERISAVVNADGGIYGGAEGDFGYTGINALLDWAPEFRKVDGDPFYFQARSSSFEAAVPESGLLLFSSVSYPEAYALTVSDRSLVIDDRTAAEMASHDAAVYMNHPASIPDIGMEIPDETARKIEKAVLLFDDDGESGYLTGWLDMDSASSARTLSTLLRNELLKGIRQRGEKTDFAVLSGYFRPDGDILYIDYPGIDRGMVEAMAKASAGGV